MKKISFVFLVTATIMLSGCATNIINDFPIVLEERKKTTSVTNVKPKHNSRTETQNVSKWQESLVEKQKFKIRNRRTE